LWATWNPTRDVVQDTFIRYVRITAGEADNTMQNRDHSQ
jgi:hypothetical protein